MRKKADLLNATTSAIVFPKTKADNDTQTLAAFDKYATDALVLKLRRDGVSRVKLKHSAVFCINLDLACPSEETIRDVVAVSIALTDGLENALALINCGWGLRGTFTLA